MAAIQRIKDAYQRFNPGFPSEAKFIEKDYQALYESGGKVAALSKYFAGVAIIISCLGLFGLSAFTVQKRQKEVGIRKITGASVSSVALLLSGDFLKLVVVAMLIAFPLAWWAMHTWLETFAYRINLRSDINPQ